MTNPTKAAEALDQWPVPINAKMGYGPTLDDIHNFYWIHKDTIRESLQLLDAKQRGDDGWRDISTALNDGEMVLLYDEKQGVVVGEWENDEWTAHPGNYYDVTLNPTHWRKLPSAPKETI